MTRIAAGGYSVLFQLLFDADDICWVLRIRLPRPDELLTPEQQLTESLLLDSEITTMHYVREKSNIPVPKVYGHDTSFSNSLGHPYMFLELVPGRQLQCGRQCPVHSTNVTDSLPIWLRLSTSSEH